MARRVFIDANCLIQCGKPLNSILIDRIVDLVAADFVTLITTDLTITEVAKKHAVNDHNEIKDFARLHIANAYELATGIVLPNLTKQELFENLFNAYFVQVNAALNSMHAKILKIDNVKPSLIFDDYSKSKGFFAPDAKKHQFPDAFIFESLKSEFNHKDPLIIVSMDGDYEKACEETDGVELVKSVEDLFALFGLATDKHDTLTFLQESMGLVIEAFNAEVNNWGLDVADVEDGEIDSAEVVDVEFTDLTSFKSANESGNIILFGEARLTTTIEFHHPDWDTASYDKEDNKYFFWNTISGNFDTPLEVKFSMEVSIVNDKLASVVRLHFEKDDFIWINVNHYEDFN